MTGATAVETIDLPGLDGSNPLAYLSALGTLRLLTRPDRTPRLGWHRAHGGWTARLRLDDLVSEPELAQTLAERLRRSAGLPAFELADDLAVAPEEFRTYAAAAAAAASPENREWADFVAAFGCESVVDPSGSRTTIRDTALRTMSGAGHQHFLKTMRSVLGAVEAEHVRKALFAPWTYDDPVEGSTLRWDPNDDVRYALRWRNPSGDPARKKRGSMLGANALAVHGMPLLPTAPAGRRLATTGFSRFRRDTAWTWPIWEPLASLPVVRSLLAAAELQATDLGPEARRRLLRRGVTEVYRSRRIRVGKFRNFSPAQPV